MKNYNWRRNLILILLNFDFRPWLWQKIKYLLAECRAQKRIIYGTRILVVWIFLGERRIFAIIRRTNLKQEILYMIIYTIFILIAARKLFLSYTVILSYRFFDVERWLIKTVRNRWPVCYRVTRCTNIISWTCHFYRYFLEISIDFSIATFIL